MDKAIILVVLVYWLTSTAYVIHHHYKNGERAFGVVLAAVLLGPILAFIIKDETNEVKNQLEEDRIREEEHIRWLGAHRLPPFQHVPPPPNRRPNAKPYIKDFKFFKG